METVAPFLWIALLAAVLAIPGLAFLLGTGRRHRQDRWRLRPVRRLIGLLLVALACVTALLAASVVQYVRLTTDAPVGTLAFSQNQPQQFVATLALNGREPRSYPLNGDAWQLDARVVRWRLPALLAGLPPIYRIERLSGRYEDPEQERTGARSVHDLREFPTPDIGSLKRRFGAWLRFVDVQYGSAAYLPMIDGARYRIFMDPRGALFARPDDARTEQLLREHGW
ncbi:hypothetical protein V8Z80_04560 [Orrella sp. JC864]|uniref:hypothetical protein n=1 Tax=Orrella sp. JC864 TaxID=3120298 RepID=UPI0012BD22EA